VCILGVVGILVVVDIVSGVSAVCAVCTTAVSSSGADGTPEEQADLQFAGISLLVNLANHDDTREALQPALGIARAALTRGEFSSTCDKDVKSALAFMRNLAANDALRAKLAPDVPQVGVHTVTSPEKARHLPQSITRMHTFTRQTLYTLHTPHTTTHSTHHTSYLQTSISGKCKSKCIFIGPLKQRTAGTT
jgi:hypothetical protein